MQVPTLLQLEFVLQASVHSQIPASLQLPESQASAQQRPVRH